MVAAVALALCCFGCAAMSSYLQPLLRHQLEGASPPEDRTSIIRSWARPLLIRGLIPELCELRLEEALVVVALDERE